MCDVRRPAWAEQTPAMRDYYDHYWGLPVHDDRQLFEMLSLELFQAGLTWRTIWDRRQSFEHAFANFDVDRVAAFTAADIDRLCQDKTIIRNRRKISAVVVNARVIQGLHRAGQSFDDYVWRFVGYRPQRLILTPTELLPAQTAQSRAMAKQFKADGFKFVGPTIMYSFMTAVGLVNARC
ncbi:MAG: DNA-3-methyladenine glycosylase I [Limosilactobacillus pontis]|uniref:DNA-3-methyladenine glycosylase I n=1 Tax=Limosilactobacillus pontis TaxID=35787 RepID=A0A2J6NQC5_9LACO|nr:DNA-3-methyladenine glycosylase I [Limosilactobacillus pontis]PMB83520.1 DNA-3-methyladenine glycosylase I [Limosilactobacillus pontis]